MCNSIFQSVTSVPVISTLLAKSVFWHDSLSLNTCIYLVALLLTIFIIHVCAIRCPIYIPTVTCNVKVKMLKFIYIANGSCRNANWGLSFDRTGWSKCPATFPYINGLYRSRASRKSHDWIYLLEQARCCNNGKSNAQCVQANWHLGFDR